MTRQESRRHHFVPKFLLRPWLINEPTGQRNLWGYRWDAKLGGLIRKRRGLDSFCCQLDLLSLHAHSEGRDAIERIFFGEIDTKGAIARDILVKAGPNKLSNDQRCDFARLLMSLEARRPTIVAKIRTEGEAALVAAINDDPEIRDALTAVGVNDRPSDFVEGIRGSFLMDRATANIQKLVDNPVVGHRLINACWYVKRIPEYEGSLVLSDRPLIRLRGYDHPTATWVLPLDPFTVFIACSDRASLSELKRISGQRLSKRLNVDSAKQAERFVFCADQSHERWLSKHLQPR